MRHASKLVFLATVGSLALGSVAMGEDCLLPPTELEVFFEVGDVNGDGVTDVVVAEPFTVTGAGPVVAVSGLDGRPLQVFGTPAGVKYFGMGVGQVADLDNDGGAELAVASLSYDLPSAPVVLLHIYSVASGQPIGVVEIRDETALTPADIRLLGDLDEDRTVGPTDASILLDYLTGQGTIGDRALADVDQDGLVELGDAVRLLSRTGMSLDDCRRALVAAQLNEMMLADPWDQGTQQLGLLGCALCWIRCWAAMSQAADCAAYCQAQFDACRDAPTQWDECECMINVRTTCMPTCLAQVANAAGSCGSCVWKCAPRPSYR